MSDYKLRTRSIRFKSKCLMKPKEVKISTTSGITYIEAIPKVYKEELSDKEMEMLYNSFIKLGKDLYNANKDNISKLTFQSVTCLNINPSGSLLNVSNITDKNNLIDTWLNANKLHKSDLYNCKRTNLNYLILKNGKWNSTDTLYNWLLNNFIPDTNEAYNDQYLLYDNGMLVDLSMFMYLVIQAIINQKAIDYGKKAKGNERFNDFMFINNADTTSFKLNDFMKYLQEAIEIYDKQNIYVLSRYDKLTFDDNNGYKVIREYESLFGLLWYIFKLNIVELCTNTYGGEFIPLNICIDCGNPILSHNLRCNNCDINNVRARKSKSRQNKKDNIN